MQGGYSLDFYALQPDVGLFVHGILMTLRLSVISIAISFALGIPGVIARLTGPRWVRALIRVYIDLMRGTPILVLLYVLYFGLAASHLPLSPVTAGIVTLVAYTTAYVIEIYRGGIRGVATGQVEAAVALNLRPFDRWTQVVLPQAVRIVLPALGNQVVSVVLATSVVSLISVQEVTYATNDAASQTYRYVEAYIVAVVIYFVLVQLINALWRLASYLLVGRTG